MANKKKITLNDDVLWAVVRKGWFGGGVVQSVWPAKEAAVEHAAFLEDVHNHKTKFVVQRAPLLFPPSTK